MNLHIKSHGVSLKRLENEAHITWLHFVVYQPTQLKLSKLLAHKPVGESPLRKENVKPAG